MGEYDLTRWCFLRALAFIYLMGFLIAAHQFKALCGERGILPVPLFFKRTSFRNHPSLFWFFHSDRIFQFTAWLGVVLSLIALSSASDYWGFAGHMIIWFVLWLLYLSFVNVGQTFYSFGWESLLLETGVLAIFLGPNSVQAPVVVIWMMRWVLFRNMFGAGLIKLRGDKCWRDLTCLYVHYQTQPLPNPLSWYFHYFPKWMHQGGVLFNHAVELIAPWFYFFPPPLCYVGGILTFIFQGVLILSGNLSWLNYITLVLTISCFDDAFLRHIVPIQLPIAEPIGLNYAIVLALLTIAIIYLSIRPARNLFARRQLMNASFDSLHLVNTYGAFGSVTKRRREIVIKGTMGDRNAPESEWKEYEFKGKPGNTKRRPCVVSPYHWRLDWQMWFAAMSDYNYHPWILNVIAKLLAGDKEFIRLMGNNPFPDGAPKYIRADLYEYRFSSWENNSGHWWQRRKLGEYLPPLALQDDNFRAVLGRFGWFE